MANGLVSPSQFPGLAVDLGRLSAGFSQGQQMAQRQQQLTAGQQQIEAQREKDRLRSIITGAVQVQAIPTSEGKLAFLRNRIIDLQRQGLPSNDTQEALDLFEAGKIDEANQLINQTVQIGERLGFISPMAQQKRFEPVFDEQGNIVAQREVGTGQVTSDPRAEMMQKRNAEEIKADLKATDDQFERSQKLRAELAKSSGEFKKVESAFERINASNVGTAAGDLALIFNFMKMLDPGSTVREGEFANAQNAAGAGGRIRSLYNNILEGTRLTTEQRKDFTTRSADLFKSAERLNKRDEERILSIGKQFDVPKSLILGEEEPLSEEELLELQNLRRRKRAGEI